MEYITGKIRDKIREHENKDEASNTNFLTPAEMAEALVILRGYDYCILGGYEEAERKLLVIGSESSDISKYAKLIRIEAISCNKLNHRDVLGSVLGLGIKREMIGDIIITESCAYVIVMNEMFNYIKNNLDKVGHEKIKITESSFDNLNERNSKIEKNFNVASLRVDAIVSVVFGLSREESNKLINAEKILVNYMPCKNNSKQIKIDDVISVRGYGRVKIIELLGETSKGRLKIKGEM